MKSRITGRNYEILRDDDDLYPIKVNKNQTDKTLKKLRDALEQVQIILKDAYDKENSDLYYLIADEVFRESNIDISDGKIWKLKFAVDNIDELQKFLAEHNDEIMRAEQKITLCDIGYKKNILSDSEHMLWERCITKTDEEEVVEEIIFNSSELMHRKRTIVYEPDESGRHSTSITYENLPTSKKLLQTIENTKTQMAEGKDLYNLKR